MFRRCCAILSLASLFLVSPITAAGSIERDAVSVVENHTGLEVVKRRFGMDTIFEFEPFAVRADTKVPGFSDPIGTGPDPALKIFSGRVEHMDLLGNFYPFNPYNPAEYAPTSESVQTDGIVNRILHGGPLPNHKKLIDTNLSLLKSGMSKFSNQPRTRESSPLVLAGFGSVSELFTPTRLHWTHCPDYVYKRKRYGDAKKDKTRRTKMPSNFCYLI